MSQHIIRVATLNIRNTADRWPERRDLLIQQLVELQPDVIGIQEIRRYPDQASWIARRVNALLERPYSFRVASKTGIMRWREGIGIFTRLPIVKHDVLNLHGGHRVAQLAILGSADEGEFVFCNTHLHHAPGRSELRARQAGRLLEWLDEYARLPRVLVGDFNAQPHDPAIVAITARMRSVYFDLHGSEPERTAPAPLARRDVEHGHVIDFIFADDGVEIHRAWRTFELVHPDDIALTASDHYGLAADISLRWR